MLPGLQVPPGQQENRQAQQDQLVQLVLQDQLEQQVVQVSLARQDQSELPVPLEALVLLVVLVQPERQVRLDLPARLAHRGQPD